MNAKRKCILLSFFLIWPLVSYASADLFGWVDTKWGMTPNEIRELFPLCVDKNDKIELSNYEIGSNEYRVFFTFKSDSLIRVQLTPENMDTACRDADYHYAYLFDKLTLKYGKHHHILNKNGEIRRNKECIWQFPSTIISLYYSRMDIPEFPETKTITEYVIEKQLESLEEIWSKMLKTQKEYEWYLKTKLDLLRRQTDLENKRNENHQGQGIAAQSICSLTLNYIDSTTIDLEKL